MRTRQLKGDHHQGRRELAVGVVDLDHPCRTPVDLCGLSRGKPKLA